MFTPTLEEFYDFPAYIRKIEAEGAHLAGICKVIPPGGWFEREYDLSGPLGKMMVTKPIRQYMSGKQGAFTLNIEEKKDMTVAEFKDYCEQHSYDCESLPDRERQFWRMNSAVSNDPPLYGMRQGVCLYSALI